MIMKNLFRIFAHSTFHFWKFAAAVPTLLAVLEIVVFGWSPNNGMLKSLFNPKAICHNVDTGFEGKYYRYQTSIALQPPLYLEVVPLSLSKPHRMLIDTPENTSIFKVETDTLKVSPLAVEYRYSSDHNIIKSLIFPNRFMKREAIILQLVVLTPDPLLEDQCKLNTSAFY